MGHSRNESVKRAESTATNILKIKVLHFALDFKLETHTLSYANRTHCTVYTEYNTVCVYIQGMESVLSPYGIKWKSKSIFWLLNIGFKFSNLVSVFDFR